MIITEDGVFTHLPGTVRRPGDVSQDGNHGVTQNTYDKIVNDNLVELTARLDKEEVPSEIREHPLLEHYLELMAAARILRRMRVHQEIVDSLFADANIKLRLFFELHGILEDISPIAHVHGEDESYLPPVSKWDYGFKGFKDEF